MRGYYPLIGALLLALSMVAQAEEPLSPASERYIEMLSNGGPATIRSTARSMHRSGESDPRVLDVAAEVLLRDYQAATGGTEVDALAWITNALSNAETDRYQGVLQTVKEGAGHRKLANYANRNLSNRLPEGEPYEAGSVALTEVAEATAQNSAQSAPAQRTDGQYHPISEVRPGMSRTEAVAIAGPPTASHQHQTGKAWRPFNFRGQDVMREQALYRGQGRIVFSNTSQYSSEWQVLEVILDEDESGYP
ncbi:hypothetical protein [Marinimicrobium sp. ABcell2]|uniref:hypothetical protein n=1 Tax=Marinimicrobium sp. ABcell2 TaxID=3069751 RepID=UPI0027B7E506|nr:hypothetical protein [Marinimicrobium sp. ABcell2]MDQ2078498.1 hypothetical protein [Marinimicrobium sp. ABcell2]